MSLFETALSLFDAGADTVEIAQAMSIKEAEAEAVLFHALRIRRDQRAHTSDHGPMAKVAEEVGVATHR